MSNWVTEEVRKISDWFRTDYKELVERIETLEGRLKALEGSNGKV